MSRHRVKALSLDDDDDFYEEDDYEGEDDAGGAGDGLTDEDREQLRLGTIEVRRQLGSDSDFTTDAEIQESLWHYYYDVGKSVTYLKNKNKPAAKKTPKKSERIFRTTSFGAEQSRQLPPPPISASDFFKDTPWLNVPSERLAVIKALPSPYKGGLLGGSSSEPKMSKLAALAAKRRLKEKENIAANPPPAKPTDESTYISSLDRLRINANTPKSTRSESPQIAKRSSQSEVKVEPTKGGVRHSKDIDKHQPTPDTTTKDSQDRLPTAIVSRARPSAFASILTADPTLSAYDHQLPDSLSGGISLGYPRTKPFDFTDPSPDDIVNNAQKSKAPTASKASTKSNAPKATEALNQDMKKLAVSQQPVSKTKGLDVLAEYQKTKKKPAANFVVIGHVDAGKSTLMGRLLYDLKAIDQRTMDRYKREAEKIGKGSFAFAWVLDQGSEERERGVTIDIATNRFETKKTSFTILDAPGHQDFVPNMIAGASQADFAVLVIDASIGNFESGLKGQTKEHALLARSMGVQRIIVAINKMDQVNWAKDRFDEIRQQIMAFLTTAGFQQQNLAFIPCSGLQGDNILKRTQSPDATWYEGNTLVDELDKSEPTTYALDKPLRMSIADIFRGGVQNPLSISGRVDSGSLQSGEVIKIMPSGELALIKGIEVDEETAEWAVAGQNVILHLADIDPAHIKTGDVVCSQASPITSIKSFTAKLLAFEHMTPMHLDVHKGRLHVPARVSQLLATLDKTSGQVIKKKPKIVQPGSLVQVKVELEQAVPLEAPARIVLRSQGQTVAAGLLQ